MKHSLRSKLTLALGLSALIPLLLMGVLAIWLINLTNRTAVVNLEKQSANIVAAETNKFISDALNILDIRVGYAEKSIIAATDQEFLLTKLLEANSYLLEVSFLDKNGLETLRKSDIQDVKLVESQNFGNLDIFRHALNGSQIISDVRFAEKNPYVSIFSPVRNSNGDVIMVVRAIVDLSALESMASEIKLGETGKVYVTTPRGKIVASKDSVSYGKLLPWPKNILSSLETSNFGVVANSPNGEQVLISTLPIEKLDLRVAVEWPTQEAYGIVNTLTRNMLLFTILAISIALFLGWLVGKKILGPLERLTAGANKIGKGSFNEKIDIHSGDELEELGHSFESMEKDLEKIQQLKVAEAKADALAESLRKEKQLSKIKEDFINNTSHQLRTPLSVIRWSSELLSVAVQDPKLKDIVKGVQVGTAELNAIVHDLITVSNYGFGYKNTRTDTVDLVGLVKTIVTGYEKQMTERLIVLKVNAKETVNAVGDKEAIKEVLTNLIDNAITYSKDKGIIELNVENQPGNVLVSVKDFGIGVPANEHKSLFGQFFRATNSIEKKNVGTGLGLYICNLIIEGHKGRIWFDSQHNVGSTFYISLPKK